MRTETSYKVQIHDEGDDGLWAEVDDLPGCFAAGVDEQDLLDSLREAISFYLEIDPPEVEFGPAEDIVQKRELRLIAAR